MRLPLLTITALLTACTAAPSSGIPHAAVPPQSVVTTALFHYAKTTQAQAAQELEYSYAMHGAKPGEVLPACGRTAVGHCSALKTLLNDYKYDRNQDRRLGAVEQP